MKINKGDVILLCILFATLVLYTVNEFNILVGLSQFDTPAWTLFGVIFGGELLSFAIYKIGMAKYETKDEKGTIKQIKEDIEEIEEQAAAEKEKEEKAEEKTEDDKKGKHTNAEQTNE